MNQHANKEPRVTERTEYFLPEGEQAGYQNILAEPKKNGKDLPYRDRQGQDGWRHGEGKCNISLGNSWTRGEGRVKIMKIFENYAKEFVLYPKKKKKKIHYIH